MELGKSFKIFGAGLSLLGVYYSSKDLREHLGSGKWLEAGVDVTSIGAAGDGIYEAGLILAGQTAPKLLARLNPVVGLALIINTATQKTVTNYQNTYHWLPVKEQMTVKIGEALSGFGDLWQKVKALESVTSPISNFNKFSNGVDMLLDWR